MRCTMFSLCDFYKNIVNLTKNIINKITVNRKPNTNAVKQKKQPPKNTPRSKIMRFYFNDPYYPELIGVIDNPKPIGLNIAVDNLVTGEHPFDSPQGLACNSYAILCQGINIFNSLFHLTKWASANSIRVIPNAGVQANAFYDRRYFKFFHFESNGKKIYTSLSADIVLHELGHGLLDAIRPDLFSAASSEVWAFHESFGDINSIICSLHFDPIIDRMLSETNSNLKQSNIVSKVAEEFGVGLGSLCGLREAFNDFKYVSPNTLPKSAPNGGLSSEVHSFSRIMTGIFYEVLCDIYEKLGKNKEALLKTRDYLKQTFYMACTKAPCSPNFFETFCESWLDEDAKMSVSHKDVLVRVFTNRSIFRMSKMNVNDVNVEKQKLMTNLSEKVRFDKYLYEMSVKDLFADSVFPLGNEEYADMKVQLAVDEMYMKSDFFTWQKVSSPFEESKIAAKNLLEYIFENKLIGKDEESMWYKNDNNTLTRRFFQCDCYMNNCKFEGNPEYGKCWKPKNNSGCCTYGSCANLKQETSKKIEKTCNVRYSSSCGSTKYNTKCR